MTKKKILFKNLSIFLCLVPMLFLSFFCLVPKREDMFVSADYVSTEDFTFYGSNIVTYAQCFNTDRVYDGNNFLNISFSITSSGGVYTAGFNGNFKITTSAGYRNINSTRSIPEVNNSDPISAYSSTYEFLLTFSDLTNYGVFASVYRYGNLTSSINRVVLTHDSWSDRAYDRTFIVYYDSFDNYVAFVFNINPYGDYLNYRPYLFDYRTYYINLSYLTDNSYYQAGYTDGYNQGTADGSNSGYSDGYKAGEIIGYNNGYNAGVETGGNYSFNSLIGAVIDAPVSAFTSLLNFELLGVNILGLITGLLSLAVIVLIIKLCMGGR